MNYSDKKILVIKKVRRPAMKGREKKLDILYITNVPSPYRVDYFNELGKFSNLTVLFEKSTSDERDSSWKDYNFKNFEGIVLSGRKITVDSAFCLDVVNYLKRKKYDYIVVTDFLLPTGMLAIIYMRLKGIKYWLESDGGFSKNGKGIKEKIKKFFIKDADGYFSTGREHDKYYISYGADSRKIHRYSFTSLMNEDLLPLLPSEDEKKFLKRKMNMIEKKIIISVGRLSNQNGYEKSFDVLIDVAEKIGDNYGLYIIGEQPTEELFQIIGKRDLNNVHFIDAMRKNELALSYRVADMVVCLSQEEGSLVFSEAMVYGLPIIVSDKITAATELIKNYKNGYVVSVENITLISDKIEKILQDCSLHNCMVKASRDVVNNYVKENKGIEQYKKLCIWDDKFWIKQYYKNKLNIEATNVVLAVGQFIPRKGFDILLKVANHMRNDDTVFVFVGGEVTDEYMSYVKENSLDNIKFVGYLPKNNLAEYYCAADLFVHPTREDIWGLVINEAMAYGLAVVTTKRCNAGLELVCNGANGYVISVDNSEELYIAIEKVLSHRKEMGEKSLEIIANFTIENMVKEHIRYFDMEGNHIKNGEF